MLPGQIATAILIEPRQHTPGKFSLFERVLLGRHWIVNNKCDE
jgi:hypothetical protein